jgi:hypothetical protein
VSDVTRGRDSGHLEGAVQTAGGQETFNATVSAMLDDARGWRLAEMRKRRGLTQEQVATGWGYGRRATWSIWTTRRSSSIV